MNISQFVFGYLFPFLWDVIHAAGGDDQTVSDAYNFFSNFLQNDWTGIAVDLAFLPISVWFTLKYSLSTILRLVQDATDFVNQYVVPIWSYLIADLNYLLTWVNSAGSLIWNIAVTVFDSLIAVWLDALRFANWLYWNAYNLLVSFVQDTANFFFTRVMPLIQAFFSPYAVYVSWLTELYNLARSFLLSFVQDPGAFILSVVRPFIDAILSPFIPLLDFLAWWQTVGAHVVTEFVNDPLRFVLDTLAPQFLDWLTNLIAENW